MALDRTRPYTLKEAALVIGMSHFWLRDRLKDKSAVREIAFRTRGDTGHWRFQPAPFDKLAARYKAGLGLGRSVASRPSARPLPEKQEKEPRRGASLMQIYRESRAA